MQLSLECAVACLSFCVSLCIHVVSFLACLLLLLNYPSPFPFCSWAVNGLWCQLLLCPQCLGWCPLSEGTAFAVENLSLQLFGP